MSLFRAPLADLFQSLLLAIGVSLKLLNLSHQFVDLCLLLLLQGLFQLNLLLSQLERDRIISLSVPGKCICKLSFNQVAVSKS